MNEGVYRSPEWLRKFADFEIKTGKDLSNKTGETTKDKSEPKKRLSDWDKKWKDADEYKFKDFYKEMYPKDFQDKYRGYMFSSDLEDIHKRYRGNFEIWDKYDLWINWNKKWDDLDKKLFKDFYKDTYPEDFRYKYRSMILDYDLEDIRKRYCGNFKIFDEYDTWLKGKADREESKRKEEEERKRKKEESKRIEKDLIDLRDRIISDFRSAPYHDKVSTPTINGQICFVYIFEDGTKLTLEDNKLTYGNIIYTLGLIYRNMFVKLANSIFESELWKANHKRPSGQRKSHQKTNYSSDPKSNHPKWNLYQNLKQTIHRREEQLKNMDKNHPDRPSLENEYRTAKTALDRMKKQYKFEHLINFYSFKIN
jgi:hypothetical protein